MSHARNEVLSRERVVSLGECALVICTRDPFRFRCVRGIVTLRWLTGDAIRCCIRVREFAHRSRLTWSSNFERKGEVS